METKNLTEKYMDLRFKKLELETKKLVPEDLEVNSGLDHAVLLTRELDENINSKLVLIEDLRIATEEELKASLIYEHAYDDLMLNTDFSEVLGTNKPTVAQKDAYIRTELSDLYDAKKISGEKVSMIKKQVDVVDNRISSDKMRLRLILKL